MSLETQVAALTSATTNLLDAVNVKKSTLDQRVTDAAAEVTKAAQQATAAAGSAATVSAVNTAAQTQANAAASSASQANAARDAAIAAAAVASAPTERLAAISSQIHSGTVVRAFLYDTSKDSDGGAWRKRCADKSWYQEPVQTGKWLGRATNEAGARAISGAVANDYYQNTTDGKYYRLNASGQTEVFRGNSREFPAVAAIVAEPSRVVIYDMVTPGCPMWMVFTQSAARAIGTSTALTSVVQLNGRLSVGSNGGGVHFVDFIKDDVRRGFDATTSANNTRFNGTIRDRNADLGRTPTGDAAPISAWVNDVAITVLPGAPIDPATGLPTPTTAVATNVGVSVIRHDGVVANLTASNNSYAPVRKVAFLGGRLAFSFTFINLSTLAQVDDQFTHVVDIPAASTVITHNAASTSLRGEYYNPANGQLRFLDGFNRAGALVNLTATEKGFSNTAGLSLMSRNPAAPSRGALAIITKDYNTGWLVGDNRLATLSDSVAETVAGSGELATANYQTAAGHDNVTTSLSASSFSVSAGTTASRAFLNLVTVPGRTYRVTSRTDSLTGGFASIFARDGVGGQGTVLNGSGQGIATSVGVLTVFTFVAATSQTNLLWVISVAAGGVFSSVSVALAEPDRSVRNNGLTINGTLTKTPVADAAQLVAYSGWSALNYLQQPYSSALDFDTGEWTVGGWMNLPSVLPISSFPVVGAERVTNGGFDTDTWWVKEAGWEISGGTAKLVGANTNQLLTPSGTVEVGKTYLVEFDLISTGAINVVFGANYRGVTAGVGRKGVIGAVTSTGRIGFQSGGNIELDNVTIREVAPGVILDRSAPGGSRVFVGVTGNGALVAAAFDGTTTRAVTTTQTYNTAQWTKVRADYRSGRLSISVNGIEVAVTNGAPLLTLNNPDATLTLGNSRTLDAPFPGSLALWRMGATVPSTEQAQMIHRTELQLFQPGAKCLIDGTSSAVTALAYDNDTDELVVGTSWGHSTFRDLLRVESAATTVGGTVSLSASGGMLLSGNAGARVYVPAQNLRDELRRKEEARRALGKEPVFFDFDTVSFTASTTSGSNVLTSVASIVGTPAIGMGVTGAGIPAGTTITGINGTTYYLSANATATATGTAVAMGQSSFTLQQGYTAKAVYVAEALKREGPTRAYTRAFDGFRETINFGVAPASAVWVSIMAVRSN